MRKTYTKRVPSPHTQHRQEERDRERKIEQQNQADTQTESERKRQGKGEKGQKDTNHSVICRDTVRDRDGGRHT